MKDSKFLNLTLILILLSIFLYSNLQSQEVQSKNNLPTNTDSTGQADNSEIKKKDTICFKYTFYPKDTLIYKVVAADSITHNLDNPVFKVRTETLEVVCDSVDKQSNYYLTMRTLTLDSKEWSKDQDTVTRNSSPWLGKRVRLVIDSLGKREKVYLLDSTFSITSPGGVFTPYLFFPLRETCKALGTSWLVKTEDTLYENAYPPGILDQTSLFRIKDTINIDSEKFALVTFVKTGKGIYGITNEEMTLEVDNVINMYGELMISLENFIPVQYIATEEQKLHVTINDGTRVPTWQNTMIKFNLISFKRDTSFLDNDIQKLKKELKKQKHIN
jgi:hypothetical protein